MKPKKGAAPLNACFEHPSAKGPSFEFSFGDSQMLGSQKQPPVVDVFGAHCEKKWSTFKQQQRPSPFQIKTNFEESTKGSSTYGKSIKNDCRGLDDVLNDLQSAYDDELDDFGK